MDRKQNQTEEAWEVFTRDEQGHYYTYKEARRAAKTIGIKTNSEYRKKRKRDRRLPGCPWQVYENRWTTWYAFLGKSDPSWFNYKETKKLVKKHKIKNIMEYRALAKKIKGLPSCPHKIYKDEWTNWYAFFGKSDPNRFSYNEIKKIAKKHKIKNQKEYKDLVKQIKGLPYSPDVTCKDDWTGWHCFLDKERPSKHFAYKKAKEIVKKHKIKSWSEYKKLVKKIKGLPSSPYKMYESEWTNLYDFLGKNDPNRFSYKEAKKIIKKHKIKNHKEYADFAKQKGLPSAPYSTYKDEWTNWHDFLGKQKSG